MAKKFSFQHDDRGSIQVIEDDHNLGEKTARSLLQSNFKSAKYWERIDLNSAVRLYCCQI